MNLSDRIAKKMEEGAAPKPSIKKAITPMSAKTLVKLIRDGYSVTDLVKYIRATDKTFTDVKLADLIMHAVFNGETAATRKAGDPDLLVGSLKSAIKHANNATKSDTQKEFLRCARAYLKECC